MNKQNFVRFLVENKVLTFGDFVTKSGRNTPYFFNLGNLHTGNAINEIGEYYANAVRENFGTQVENLFGPAYKAIPLAIAAASALAYNHNVNVSYTFNRKEVKDHGEGGWLVGDDYLNVGQGQEIRVVILEDVTTAGTSIREVVPGLRALPGVKVCGLLVGLDRMERGKGAQAALEELLGFTWLQT